jgi:hypothetical protein
MTKKAASKKNALVSKVETTSDATTAAVASKSSPLFSFLLLPLLLATVAVCVGYYFRGNLFSFRVGRPLLPSFSPTVNFVEHNAVRVDGYEINILLAFLFSSLINHQDIRFNFQLVLFLMISVLLILSSDLSMLVLKLRNEPLVLLNSKISTEVPRWTPSDIAQLLSTQDISGVFRSNTSAIFGTYYDDNRPMRTLHSVPNSIRYEPNVTLTRAELLKAFPSQTGTGADVSPPYHILSTTLDTVRPQLESQFDLRELLSLNPAKSSVNLWLSSPGSVTPCHFDGYYNMYLQLSGTKRFTLLRPEARGALSMYPFLHPSFGQCRHSFMEEAGGSAGGGGSGGGGRRGGGGGGGGVVPDEEWARRVEVLLQPGELLFLPPYWLHEVSASPPPSPSSVSLNVWTDIPSSDLLGHIMQVPVPGLSTHKVDPSLPIPLSAEDMTLLPVHLSSLAGRYILGYLLAVEVVEGTIGKAKTRGIIDDVASRYRHLIDDGVLMDMPSIMRDPLSELLSQWKVPLIAKKKDIKYKEYVGDDDTQLIEEIKIYTKSLIKVFKTADFHIQPIVMGLYLEFLSERVCSTSRASTFVSLLQHTYRRHTSGAR